jgi:hypothetical protein
MINNEISPAMSSVSERGATVSVITPFDNSKAGNFVMQEIWKDIKGYEGMYQVSNLGRVKSLKRKGRRRDTIMKGVVGNRGYRIIVLRNNKHRQQIVAHRLAAIAFIPNPENKKEVNHKDFDKLNNHVDNLEWCTPKENTRHALYNGRMNWDNAVRGEKHGRSKFTEDQVKGIKSHLRDGIKNQRQLAIEYNVSITTIYNIRINKTWSHVSI